MPPSMKTRRQVSTRSKAVANVGSFARVSKTGGNSSVKKEPITVSLVKDMRVLEAITPASRKRKAFATVQDAESSSDERASTSRTTSSASTSNKSCQPIVKRGRGRPPSKKTRPEPAPRKRARSPSVSDSDESAINTGALLKRLRLESSPSRASSPLTADTSIAGSDDAEGEPDQEKTRLRQDVQQLPDEVLSLLDLHSSLLKTLTLHYAHNGFNAPVDLRILCPNVARAWGKRKVTDTEIQTCIGVLHYTSASSSSNHGIPLSLCNYGRGKICIEMDPSTRILGVGASPLDEKKLNKVFQDNIQSLWSSFVSKDSHITETAGSVFMNTLPKASITLCESVAKAGPLWVKGQKRLEELKHGITIKKQQRAGAASAKKQVLGETSPQRESAGDTQMTTPTNDTNTDSAPKKTSLLDRIRYKSLQKSINSGSQLTPAQLERRAALQRVEEVSSTIGMLSSYTGEQRVPFAMAVLQEKLKDSFRMGISRQEGAVCLRLLASEVAPEWITVIVIGKKENVVVETGMQPSKAEIARRVEEIVARG